MRLFVGIALPLDIRMALGTLCAGISGTRWVKPESMHVTLRFVGEVGLGAAQDLDAALGDVHVPAFEMRFSGIADFSQKSRLKALWAGVAANPALGHLQGKVEKAVQRAGFPPDGRKFTPHVTLARFKGQRVHLGHYLEANGAFSTEPFLVESFTLFESHMGHGGSHYEVLNEYPLLTAA